MGEFQSLLGFQKHYVDLIGVKAHVPFWFCF